MSLFLEEVSHGLSKKNKKISSKWFYDYRGSKLFEQITKLKEYYPTRTEIKILKDNKIEIAEKIGKRAVLIEPGAGDIKKIAIFLSNLDKPKKYIPLDISEDYIKKVSKTFKKKFPKITITPKGYDFSGNNKLPFKILSSENVTIFFPGSTIGNFNKKDAIKFLKMLKTKFIVKSGRAAETRGCFSQHSLLSAKPIKVSAHLSRASFYSRLHCLVASPQSRFPRHR